VYGSPKADRTLSSEESLHVILAAPVGPELRYIAQVERCPGSSSGDLKPMLSR